MINYELEIEEEKLMQQLGLDRFLSVVAWDNNKPTVVAEVIEKLAQPHIRVHVEREEG